MRCSGPDHTYRRHVFPPDDPLSPPGIGPGAALHNPSQERPKAPVPSGSPGELGRGYRVLLGCLDTLWHLQRKRAICPVRLAQSPGVVLVGFEEFVNGGQDCVGCVVGFAAGAVEEYGVS